ncbi:hypothetical protein DRW07_05265 [Alteromonas sediminis]|uniref:Serine aminopeptidase S33 domain-containing protein n=1 Tax=Alteromonas sediminis TaxID=2259342 RepID=A0A3N5Y555_9ALTE|nr:alpha/beta fold hydrolase [Alteromonas sediminis]RPJ68800.1 hypothetical protein DRW07_05265 [Alteromonas sediminis]
MLLRLIFLITIFLHAIKLGHTAENKVWPLKDGYLVDVDSTSIKSIEGNKIGDVLLLHQCNRDKTMWLELIQLLAVQGISSTWLDYRGFGRSVALNRDYSHSSNDRARLVVDIPQVFAQWLDNVGSLHPKVIVGASCGAGQAVALANFGADIQGLVLISPALRDFWSGKEGFSLFLSTTTVPVFSIVAKYVHILADHEHSFWTNVNTDSGTS